MFVRLKLTIKKKKTNPNKKTETTQVLILQAKNVLYDMF